MDGRISTALRSRMKSLPLGEGVSELTDEGRELICLGWLAVRGITLIHRKRSSFPQGKANLIHRKRFSLRLMFAARILP